MSKKEKLKYYPNAKVICSSCNEVHYVGSTKEELKVEICSSNHPFYLGKGGNVKIITGQVEKFYKKYGKPKDEENSSDTKNK